MLIPAVHVLCMQAYGESTCINLAQSNFQRAIQTADNVGYFGKYANTCYKNAPDGYVAKNSPLQGCVDQYSNCPALAARGCTGRNSEVQGYCCQSCTATSNDCNGISAGAGGSTSSDTRRRANPAPTAAPASTSSDTRRRANPAPTAAPASTSHDTAGNCAELVGNYGCSACCISGAGGSVASVCGASCRTGSTTTTTTTTSSGDDSCRYANDGACDEPTYCHAGTDATDCA